MTPSYSEGESHPDVPVSGAHAAAPDSPVEEIPQPGPYLDIPEPSSPKFIKIGVHLRKFVMGVMDTEQEDSEVEAFRAKADSLKVHIEVCQRL